jgi:cytoskeleton protein RodZ
VTAGQETEPSTGSRDAGSPSATPDAPALQTASTAAESPGEATAAAAGSTETTAPPATELAALSQPREPGAADPSANHTLTIAAEERSWLRVWVDGEPFRDMLLSPGESRTLSAQAGFVITFGNAGGVRLTLDGEELPPAGESGQVLRGFRLPPRPPASEP